MAGSIHGGGRGENEGKMDVYEIVTKKIVDQLEQGVIPWCKPWAGGAAGMPRNFSSTKPYRGVNVFLLSVTAAAAGFSSPFWVTYKQAAELGGNVRKGEKSLTPVVFYKQIEKSQENSEGEIEARGYSLLRYTSVFNTDQCEGLKVPDLTGAPRHEHQIIEAAQAIVDGMPNRPEINVRTSARAFYSPGHDSVTVPELSQFEKAEMFYSTLFHELGHSTGHSSRVGRDLAAGSFGNHEYSKEELVAEFCASYLCGVCGIESRTVNNSAAYISGWLSRLNDKDSRKWVPWAASQAQKAADYIQNINVEQNKAAA